MLCRFNYKFNKWTPIKLADVNAAIVKNTELKHKIY